MLRFVYIAFLLLPAAAWAQQAQATAQNQPSLAERAAAARKKSAARSNPSANPVGQANCGYKNDSIGLELKCLQGWKPVSEGEINVDHAMSGELLGTSGGPMEHQDLIKFTMKDDSGSSVVLTLTPLLVQLEPAQLKAAFITGVKAKVADVEFSDEKVSLGDAEHHFVPMRGAFGVRGIVIWQSYQLLQLKGHLLTIVVTSGSPQMIEELLTELRTHITWAAPATAPTP